MTVAPNEVISGPSSTGRAPEKDATRPTTPEVGGSTPPGRSTRRNFDCEDIVGYCPCGAPIYAESIGIGDDSLCMPCRRDARREGL